MVVSRVGRMVGCWLVWRRRQAAWRQASEHHWRRPDGVNVVSHTAHLIVTVSLRTLGLRRGGWWCSLRYRYVRCWWFGGVGLPRSPGGLWVRGWGGGCSGASRPGPAGACGGLDPPGCVGTGPCVGFRGGGRCGRGRRERVARGLVSSSWLLVPRRDGRLLVAAGRERLVL